MISKARFFMKALFIDSAKIFVAMTFFFFLFYMFAPIPDLPNQIKREIRNSIAKQLPFFPKKSIETLFSESRANAIQRVVAFPALYLFWGKQVIFDGFGRPLRYFDNKNLPSVVSNLLPHLRVTLILAFLGSILSILLSLGVSLWHVNWTWNIGLNQRRGGAELAFKALALFSNIPSCIFGIVFMFLLVSAGMFQAVWFKYFVCGVIIGYSDGIFWILSGFLKDEFKTQYNKLYIPLSATRGCPNFSLSNFKACLSGKAISNILGPTISIFRQRISILLGMTIIVEVIFNIDGLGLKSWQLLHNDSNGDYFQVMGIFISFALLWFIINMMSRAILSFRESPIH